MAVPASGTMGHVSAGVRELFNWLARKLTFWTVVPILGIVAFVYYYAYTDSLYESTAIIALQNSASTSTSLSTLVGSSLFGSSGSSTQSGAVVAYVQSLDLLKLLDKQFHLREL